MGDGDGVRCAGDLDRAVGAGALGHVVLDRLGDVAVLLAEDEPRRQLLHSGRSPDGSTSASWVTGRCVGGHPRRLRRRDVRAELLVEALLDDRQVGRAVAARDRPAARRRACCRGRRADSSKQLSPGFGAKAAT